MKGSIMSGIQREKIGECHNCEFGSIVKETMGSLGSTFIEVLANGQQLPPRTIVSCYCTSCGTTYHLDTILKQKLIHA